MVTETRQILEVLSTIKEELDFIKENMPNKDIFLTSEEKILLEESYKNERDGSIISSNDLRKKLSL